MVDSFEGFEDGDRVTVYRPYDDPDGEPSGEATFIRQDTEDPEYAWVREDTDGGRKYTVHTSDVGENKGQQ